MTCPTCLGQARILHQYTRGPNSPPGHQMVGCPDCDEGRAIRAAVLAEFDGSRPSSWPLGAAAAVDAYVQRMTETGYVPIAGKLEPLAEPLTHAQFNAGIDRLIAALREMLGPPSRPATPIGEPGPGPSIPMVRMSVLNREP